MQFQYSFILLIGNSGHAPVAAPSASCRRFPSSADRVQVGGRGRLAKGVITRIRGVVKDHRADRFPACRWRAGSATRTAAITSARPAQCAAGRELPGLRPVPYRCAGPIPLAHHQPGALSGSDSSYPFRGEGPGIRAAHHPDVRAGRARERRGLAPPSSPGPCPPRKPPGVFRAASRAARTAGRGLRHRPGPTAIVADSRRRHVHSQCSQCASSAFS